VRRAISSQELFQLFVNYFALCLDLTTPDAL
jgi:hypothetical protein